MPNTLISKQELKDRVTVSARALTKSERKRHEIARDALAVCVNTGNGELVVLVSGYNIYRDDWQYAVIPWRRSSCP